MFWNKRKEVKKCEDKQEEITVELVNEEIVIIPRVQRMRRSAVGAW